MDKHKRVNMSDVLGFVLGGGDGKRLRPLTKDRSKLAVPIAGNQRIIDFVLTNFVRSDIKKIFVTIYYKSDSLTNHIEENWKFLPTQLGQFIRVLPPQKRTEDDDAYEGSAGAIHQNRHLLDVHHPKIVAVFSGDHVYYMDIRDMVEYHLSEDADATICALPMKTSDAPREADGRFSYGVIVADENGKVIDFQEKPHNPIEIPSRPGYFWAAMGNYVFKRQILQKVLEDDHEDDGSRHDFGRNIMPRLVHDKKNVYMYDFSTNEIPDMTENERGYWADIGNIDSYYDVNMMLASVSPKINLYNKSWALMKPASKTVHSATIRHDLEEHKKKKIAGVYDSLIAEGCIISGATILNSVISSSTNVHSYSMIVDSIMLGDTDIGEDCQIKNAIIDKHVKIPSHTMIGYDLDLDESRGFKVVRDRGIVVVPRAYKFDEIQK